MHCDVLLGLSMAAMVEMTTGMIFAVKRLKIYSHFSPFFSCIMQVNKFLKYEIMLWGKEIHLNITDNSWLPTNYHSNPLWLCRYRQKRMHMGSGMDYPHFLVEARSTILIAFTFSFTPPPPSLFVCVKDLVATPWYLILLQYFLCIIIYVLLC